MKKSKHIFAIMAVAYVVIAIASSLQWIVINENILLGLSMSALFSALSDIMANVENIVMSRNEFNYTILIASGFLEMKIYQNQYNPMINIRNVKLGIESMGKGYKTAKHPNEYCRGRHIKFLNIFSQIFFILSIAVFILVPFFSIASEQFYSVVITLSAFSAMCLNLYLGEYLVDIVERKSSFQNKEQLIIQMAYPDFSQFLTFRVCCYEDYVAMTRESGGQV